MNLSRRDEDEPASLTERELEEMTSGISLMIKEYLESLPDVEEWREGYVSPRGRAQLVFDNLLTWLQSTDG